MSGNLRQTSGRRGREWIPPDRGMDRRNPDRQILGLDSIIFLWNGTVVALCYETFSNPPFPLSTLLKRLFTTLCLAQFNSRRKNARGMMNPREAILNFPHLMSTLWMEVMDVLAPSWERTHGSYTRRIRLQPQPSTVIPTLLRVVVPSWAVLLVRVHSHWASLSRRTKTGRDLREFLWPPAAIPAALHRHDAFSPLGRSIQ